MIRLKIILIYRNLIKNSQSVRLTYYFKLIINFNDGIYTKKVKDIVNQIDSIFSL